MIEIRRLRDRLTRASLAYEPWGGGKHRRIGVAIGEETVIGIVFPASPGKPLQETVFSRSLAPPESDESWSSLGDVFRELVQVANTARPVVSVALLRPLAQVKTLLLPSVNESRARLLLEHNAHRFFCIRGRVVADLVWLAGRSSGGRRRALTAVAPVSLIESIAAAATQADVELDAIVPGSVAAAFGARLFVRGLDSTSGVVALPWDGGLETVFLDRGVLQLLRSAAVPRTAEADELRPAPDGLPSSLSTAPTYGTTLAKVLAESPSDLQKLVVVDPQQGEELSVSLEGMVDAQEVIPWRSCSGSELAAFGAVALWGKAPMLYPESLRARAKRGTRLRTMTLIACTLGMFVVSGMVRVAVLREAISDVRAVRATLRPAVADVLETRATLQAVQSRGGALAGLATLRSDNVKIITALAKALPQDAYLLSLQSTSNGLRLEGRARSAAEIPAALAVSSRFQNPRLDGAIQRNFEGPQSEEQFHMDVGVVPGAGSHLRP